MKVAVFETEEWEHQACLRLEPAHAVSCTREPLDKRTAAAHAQADVVSTFVNSKLGAEVLAQFPDLKLIATRSTGYDHIDLDWCAANGVTVANVPDYGDSTVAEHAFALLLAVARNLVEAVERQGQCAGTAVAFDLDADRAAVERRRRQRHAEMSPSLDRLTVDGNDPLDVYAHAHAAIERARTGESFGDSAE